MSEYRIWIFHNFHSGDTQCTLVTDKNHQEPTERADGVDNHFHDNILPVLFVSIQMLNAFGASEADLLVWCEAISSRRTESLLFVEFANSYLTFSTDTLRSIEISIKQ